MISEFQQEYIDEARQLLKSLEHSLLELEKRPTPDEINNVYRYLHTLKGSAGMFGFTNIEKLAHELESVYSDIRDGVSQIDEFVLNLTLNAVDVFSDLIDGKDVVRETSNIIASVQNLVNKTGESCVAVTETQALKCYSIVITPEQGIFGRGVNFGAILEEIQELGASEIIIHNEAIPFERQLAERNISSRFEILLAAKCGADGIKDVFMFMKESEYTLFEIADTNLFTSVDYQQLIQLNESEVVSRVNTIRQLAPGVFEVKEKPSVEVSESVHEEEGTDVDDSKVARKARQGGNVSVATQKLDDLINIVSELVIFRSEVNHLMANDENPAVVEALEKLDRLTLRLRDSAFNIRLVPLNVINVKLQRLIRSVSKELGKEIDFITDGLDTELDRSMITSLEAPLMHIIRNAMDHGIESPQERERLNKPKKGLLKLLSYNSGDHVFIQVQDDGHGIDFEKIKAKGIEKGLISKNQNYSEKELINLMMTPGFSTADKITTVSGRGVGMDVVKRDISAMRGDIEISTEQGLGTIFTLRLPLTLTVLDTLVVQVADNKYLIPINEIEHCFRQNHAELFKKKSRQITYDGQLTPFVSLREYFKLEELNNDETVIVINKNDTRIAVVVDNIVGKLQTVYKPLNNLINADCFSGSSILGDGSMALIINALKLKN